MSPRKPVRNVKVHVPRHNSQRLGPAVTAQVEALARRRRKRVDVRQTAYEPSSALAQAIDSASEWNSLLMTARAERGPQWDIGTQQFLVDDRSNLYYDPSPLLEYQKEGQENEDKEQAEDGRSLPSSSINSGPESPQTRRSAALPSQSQNHMPFSPRHTGQFGGQGMSYANLGPVSPAQFYGGGGGGDPNMPSPMRLGGMGMGGMGGMGMGSPETSRRMTRGMGMGDEGYSGMR